jgi:ferredoxin-like protein FixX
VAELSEGREHSKWSPGLVHYKYKPEIEITKKGEACEKCAKACPVNVFDFVNGKLKVNQDNQMLCHLCNACVEESQGAVKVTYDSKTFVFFMESWGQLDCRAMVQSGVERFNAILDRFAEEMKGALK